MGSYCRYCHSTEHTLVDCDKKKSHVSCFNCNESGHMAKDRPRRNGPSSGGSSNKRPQKTPLHCGSSNDRERSSVSDPTATLISPDSNADIFAVSTQFEASSTPSPTAAIGSASVQTKAAIQS